MKTSAFAAALSIAFALQYSEAFALSLEVPIDRLLDGSSAVATIRITDGRAIDRLGYSCGGEYKAEIIESIKGHEKEAITFGSKQGLEIGKEYVIVLVNKARYIQDEIWLSENESSAPDIAHKRVVQIKACEPGLPEQMVAAFGLAAFAVEMPLEMGGRTRAAKVPLLIMWLPPRTQCTRAPSVASKDRSKWTVWVRPEELLRVFKASLSRQPGTKTVGGPGKQPIEPKDCASGAASPLRAEQI